MSSDTQAIITCPSSALNGNAGQTGHSAQIFKQQCPDI